MNNKATFQNEPEMLKFIVENHSGMTTKKIAGIIGKNPSWVEGQIDILRKEGYITIRKRAPRKTVLKALAGLIPVQKETENPTIIPVMNDNPPQESLPTKEKSHSEKGVPDGWIRHSIVARAERFQDIETISWFTRRLLREVFDEALSEYILSRQDILNKAAKEIVSRG
jgi:transposase